MSNRIDELLQKYPQLDQIEILRDELEKLSKEELSEVELESWYNLRGAIESRLENYLAASEIFKEGLKEFPDISILQLNLGLVLEKIGDMKTAINCFQKVDSKEIDGKTILLIARLCYLWSYYSEGLDFIDPIFKTYYDIKVVDDHFLFMRGLPSYGESFANKAVFAKLSNQPKVASDELEKANNELKDYPFYFIEKNLNAFLSGDWSEIHQDLSEDDQSLGFSPTLKALIESRKTDTYEKAIETLEKVKLTDKDFPWLEDILTFGKAEAAHRFNQKKDEKKFQDDFFDRQPLLFEPNHVFKFGLDEYQEKLKTLYINRIKKQK